MLELHASSLNIGYHCPGAPHLLASLGERKAGSNRLYRGTLAHSYVQAWIEQGDAAADALLEQESTLREEMRSFVDWLETQMPLGWLHRGQCERSLILPLPGELQVHCRLDWSTAVALDMRSGKGPCHVVDWKLGWGGHLPPIDRDLQMLAYGLALVSAHGGDEVEVDRVLIGARRIDHLELSGLELMSGLELLTAVCRDIVDHPDQRILGIHCEQCLAREACPERLATVEQVSALIPREVGVLALTDEQARRWAMVRGVMRDRVDQLDGALARYLEAGGYVEEGGKRLVLSQYEVDQIVDHQTVLAELVAEVGGYASSAMQTSKGLVEEALLAAGTRDAKKRTKSLFERWREKGLVTKQGRQAMRWR